MKPTREAPTPIGIRSNYNLNVSSVQWSELVDSVMPGGVASGGTSLSCQGAVQNNLRS